jgi:hypothetical protein
MESPAPFFLEVIADASGCPWMPLIGRSEVQNCRKTAGRPSEAFIRTIKKEAFEAS